MKKAILQTILMTSPFLSGYLLANETSAQETPQKNDYYEITLEGGYHISDKSLCEDEYSSGFDCFSFLDLNRSNKFFIELITKENDTASFVKSTSIRNKDSSGSYIEEDGFYGPSKIFAEVGIEKELSGGRYLMSLNFESIINFKETDSKQSEGALDPVDYFSSMNGEQTDSITTDILIELDKPKYFSSKHGDLNFSYKLSLSKI